MTLHVVSNPARLGIKRPQPITAPLRAARAFDNAMSAVMAKDRMTREARTFIIAANADERLVYLARRLNEVGSDVMQVLLTDAGSKEQEQCVNNLRFDLANLAAFALIWATPNHPNYVRGCKAIQQERLRQAHLLVLGDIKDDCASPATDNRKKFRVLFEECGEVAHAIDQVEDHGMAVGNVNAELTQVAAVCVAWLEALENTQTPKHPNTQNGGAR